MTRPPATPALCAALALALAACARPRERPPEVRVVAPAPFPSASATPQSPPETADEPTEPVPPAVNITAPRPPNAVAPIHVPLDHGRGKLVVPPEVLRAACGAGYRKGKCFGCPPDQPFERDVPLEVVAAISGSFHPGKVPGYFIKLYGPSCFDFGTFVVRGPSGWRRTRGWVYANDCYRVDLPDGSRIVCVSAGPSMGAAHIPRFRVVGLRKEEDAMLFSLSYDIDRNCMDAARGRAIGLQNFGAEIWSVPPGVQGGTSILGFDILYGRAADLKSAGDCNVVTESAPDGVIERLLGAPKRARLQFAVEGSRYSLLPESLPSARAIGADFELTEEGSDMK